MTPEVYAYSEPHVYLRDVLAYKQKQNPLFSIRAWAKQMGFQCHTSLIFFLKGQRRIRPEHVERINRGLRLEGDQEKYLRLLIQTKNVMSEKDKEDCEAQLRMLVPSPNETMLDVEKFKLVADWLHMAILEMTKLKDFKSESAWITARLKFAVPEHRVSDALNRLQQLKLLAWVDGRLVKTNDRLTTPKDRASESIREHHRQVLTNAIDAIDTQSINERCYNACTMTIDVTKMEEAKKLILKFREDMTKLLEKNEGDETYQFSMQLFKLTESKI